MKLKMIDTYKEIPPVPRMTSLKEEGYSKSYPKEK